MALRSRDREFWVWDFEKRVWMFEEGEEEEGITVWRRTVLGRQTEKEKKKKKGEKERRKKMVYKNSSLRYSISRWTSRGKSVNSDSIYSPKSSLLDSRC